MCNLHTHLSQKMNLLPAAAAAVPYSIFIHISVSADKRRQPPQMTESPSTQPAAARGLFCISNTDNER